ncbi:MAG: sigma 54-interacting transcriptional regulator, partial [Calditrichia bacterium]|nr:sigma 54-interacting transcriptional regulator [Calditrichia bacterium]
EDHIIGSVVTFLDITDRKQIEDALNDSEEKHRNLVETSQDLIFKSDSAGRFTYLNPAWEKTLGYKEDEMLGRVFSEFKPPEQATKGLNKFKSILAGQNTFGHEAIYLSKSGEDVHLVFNVQILKDSSGKVIGTQGTAHNITKRKLAEEKLKNTLIELEQLKNRLQEENIYLQEEIKLEHNFEKIIGRSESLKKVLQDVEQIAPTDSPVLILGETGTGKELIARAIHNLSIRKDRPLVKVNCGALPPNLIESELFGHEKGAFTGATGLRKGRFELADGGTIFLDEISEIPIELQVKLLRVLQESEFERVGGDRTLKVNVRIISATNRELEKSIRENKFRQDLYYRINVLSVHVPPLRERKEDIPLLTNFFVKKYSKKLGKKIERISKKTMDFLQKLSWPGNIRELENIIERAVIFSKEGILQIDESAFLKPEKIIQQQNLVPMEEMEREHIRRILESTNWIIAGACGAASILNLNSSTLRSRMKKLGIKNPKRA